MSRVSLAVRPAAFPTQPLLATLLHRFEVWTVLECYAICDLATSDLRNHKSLLELFEQHMLTPADAAGWLDLEFCLHPAIARYAGSRLLAQTVKHIVSQLKGISAQHGNYPAGRPGTLWLLQCQHRTILRCIEAGQADDAVRHTRAHLHVIRDRLLAALSQRGATRVG